MPDKMLLSGVDFTFLRSELHARRIFRSRHYADGADRPTEYRGRDLPDYVPEPNDVRLRDVPAGLADGFHERWRSEGLTQVMWVFRLDGLNTDDHRVIARFDNPKGALLFFIHEHGAPN